MTYNYCVERDKLDKVEEILMKEIQKEENEKFSKMCKSFGMSDEDIIKVNDMYNALGLR